MRTTTLALLFVAACAAPLQAQDARRDDVPAQRDDVRRSDPLKRALGDLRRFRAELRLETNAVVGHVSS